MKNEIGCDLESYWHYSAPSSDFNMVIIVKIFLALFLICWSGVGLWMLIKYDQLFGYHPDDPAESSGARMLNVTQCASVWFGFFAIAFYFLIR
jgi:hypothetical protein